MLFKDFLFRGQGGGGGGACYRRCLTVYAISVEGIRGNIHVIFFNFGLVVLDISF